MKFHTGDKVHIIGGKYKGQDGVVTGPYKIRVPVSLENQRIERYLAASNLILKAPPTNEANDVQARLDAMQEDIQKILRHLRIS